MTSRRYAQGNVTAAWLYWSALSVVVAAVCTVAVAMVLPNLEAAAITFGLGMAWSAATPVLLRAIGRRIRG